MSVVFTYFSGFMIVEASLIACGFGYSRKEIELGNDDYAGPIIAQEDFNSISVVKVVPILTGTSFAAYGTMWNI
jgi:hypothetical protein